MTEGERDQLRQILEKLEKLGFLEYEGDTAVGLAKQLANGSEDLKSKLQARIEDLKKELGQIDDDLQALDQRSSPNPCKDK